uniref:Uncharacterized protein n=1 Tax=Arundo donax TaxID=35708 RepID=A0A0A9CKX7_ARUDO
MNYIHLSFLDGVGTKSYFLTWICVVHKFLIG